MAEMDEFFNNLDIGIDLSKVQENSSYFQMTEPSMDGPNLMTQWGKNIDPDSVLQEYPRPQMVRNSYWNLNGYWECAFTEENSEPQEWTRILVPFSPEAPLSGVRRILKPGEVLWYRRYLPDIPSNDGFTILHFGAVDQIAEVFVNQKLVASHEGGYTPFSADITSALRPHGNELIVKVWDHTDTSWHGRGKQQLKCGAIWYTPQSGIWQTVWMEQVPRSHITGLAITPQYDEMQLELTVFSSEKEGECLVHFNNKQYTLPVNSLCRIPVDNGIPWSPETPHLYSFSVKLGEDVVESYFAMRKIEIKKDNKGVNRLFLNGHPYFHNGLLDQGYFPDGLYTPPADEAMIFDIQAAKEMGFNMLRKHIKVEPLRWYYHCDRLGMLVWQDMVSGGGAYDPKVIYGPMMGSEHYKDDQYELFGREDPRGREQFYNELDETVKLLYNAPSVVMWVPFNEGWGQFDAAEAVRRIEAIDKTRIIDHASGWNDQGIGQLKSQHLYMSEYRFESDFLGRAVILSEYGGYTHRVQGHNFSEHTFGYTRFETAGELLAAYNQLMEKQIIPAKDAGLCAAVYTQLTDVENELNGLITYDREIIKLPVEEVAAINRKILI